MYIRRKVYSDYDQNQYFDGYDYEEPRYYSVIMDEDELALFSDLQEYLYGDVSDVESGRDIGSIAGAVTGAGVGAAGIYGAAKRAGKYANRQQLAATNAITEATEKYRGLRKEQAALEDQIAEANKKIGKGKGAMSTKEWNELKNSTKKLQEKKDALWGKIKGKDAKGLDVLKNQTEAEYKASAEKAAKELRNKHLWKAKLGENVADTLWRKRSGKGKAAVLTAGALVPAAIGATMGRPIGGALNRGRDRD